LKNLTAPFDSAAWTADVIQPTAAVAASADPQNERLDIAPDCPVIL
jgi:hypothetical protein